jgi:hypothetical protein
MAVAAADAASEDEFICRFTFAPAAKKSRSAVETDTSFSHGKLLYGYDAYKPFACL